jgi:hypothetical protein
MSKHSRLLAHGPSLALQVLFLLRFGVAVVVVLVAIEAQVSLKVVAQALGALTFLGIFLRAN